MRVAVIHSDTLLPAAGATVTMDTGEGTTTGSTDSSGLTGFTLTSREPKSLALFFSAKLGDKAGVDMRASELDFIDCRYEVDAFYSGTFLDPNKVWSLGETFNMDKSTLFPIGTAESREVMGEGLTWFQVSANLQPIPSVSCTKGAPSEGVLQVKVTGRQVRGSLRLKLAFSVGYYTAGTPIECNFGEDIKWTIPVHIPAGQSDRLQRAFGNREYVVSARGGFVRRVLTSGVFWTPVRGRGEFYLVVVQLDDS